MRVGIVRAGFTGGIAMIRNIQRGAVLLALLVSGLAAAQTSPKIEEFYFDDDRKAMQTFEVVKGSDDAAVRRLKQMAERDGINAGKAGAQLAHLLMSAGRLQEGRSVYAQLLQRHDQTSGLHRPLLYRYGWDLYRAGEYAAALGQWQKLLVGRGINPAWAPPTMALVLWKLDRKPEALAWYAAAVRSEPARWGRGTLPADLLRDWTDEERADLARVQAAWAKAPPAWP